MAVKFYLPDGAQDRHGRARRCRASSCARRRTSCVHRAARKDPERRCRTGSARTPRRGGDPGGAGADPPASYATCAYNSIHSYRWIDAGGGGALRALPLGARGRRADAVGRGRARRAGATTSQEDEPGARRERLPHAGDRSPRPRTRWTTRRSPGRTSASAWRSAGWCSTGPELERERDGDVLVFDPTRVTDGIELSDDPILRFRGPAYSVSVARRSA